jgi:PAS domain S-box-containing protein
MNRAETIRVLLVEDDEDDFILAKGHFEELPGGRYVLDWVRTYGEALETLQQNRHDVCLVDYRLGPDDGIELLKAAKAAGCQVPVILLTGTGELTIDLAAMEAGADDYLVKRDLEAASLERSIRYSIQRKRAAAEVAFEQARLSAFGAEIGLALTRRDSLDTILDRCASAMTRFLNVELAQIWTTQDEGQLRLRASAGEPAWIKGVGEELPALQLDPKSLAAGHLTLVDNVLRDPRVRDRVLAMQLKIAGLCAYPLLLEGRLVGVVLLAGSTAFGEEIQQDLGSVANGLALCVERKRSEEELSNNEVRYQRVLENIKDIIFQVDEFGHWSFLNSSWTSMTGFHVQQTIGTYLLEYIHEEDRDRCRHVFVSLMNRKLDFCRFEARFLTASGKARWVEVFLQPSLASDGSVTGASGNLTDVTFRRQAESQIQRLAAFPKVNPNPVLEFGADAELTYANEAANRLVQEMAKSEIREILPPQADAIVRNCLETGQSHLQQEIKIEDRTLTWSFFPVSGHQIVHCYGEDITEVVSLEAQFRHSQKLESIGQLAAGVAHDFNNILTVIIGYADSVLEERQSDEELGRPLKQISDAAKRAATLTRQLLLFGRKQIIRPRVIDLNGLLQNLSNMLGRMLGEDITLQAEWEEHLPPIEADAGMVEQIVMNLAVNARDAMADNGKVRSKSLLIRTSVVAVEDDYVKHHLDSRAGEFICLTVTDTGCGMDDKTLSKIFEPFFSTKEFGKGTGLGLATVFGIVKQHKGWLDVESKPGAGTTFRVYLPTAEDTAGVPVDETSDRGMPSGNEERILLVEDEQDVRELVTEILHMLNYKVVVAQSGSEALEVWGQNDGQFDLLLSDVVMPGGMNGRELAQQFRRRKPALKVILSSGYSPETIGSLEDDTEIAFLAKPYPPQDLARLVRKCLDEASAMQPVTVPVEP